MTAVFLVLSGGDLRSDWEGMLVWVTEVVMILQSRELDSDCCLCCRVVQRAGLDGTAGVQHRHPFRCTHVAQPGTMIRGPMAAVSGLDEGWSWSWRAAGGVAAGGSGVRVLAREPAACGSPWSTAIGRGADSINE